MGTPRKDGIRLRLFNTTHVTFHNLLHRVPTYKEAMKTAKSTKDIFNILMDSAEFFDKVCELTEQKSMRSKIWKQLYKGK